MALTLPANFNPIASNALAPQRAIQEGSDGTHESVQDIAVDNHHWLLAELRPTIVSDSCDPGGNNYWENATTTWTIYGLWRRDVSRDFDTYSCTVYYQATSAAGDVRFSMQSDSATYTATGALGVAGQWAATVVDLPVDVAQTRDAIRMEVRAGAGGVARIHSVFIIPKIPATIAASVTVSDCAPIDTAQANADSPYSTYLVNELAHSCEQMRKKRRDTILSYSADATAGTPDILGRSATYETVLIVPFTSVHGQVKIRWAMYAHHASGATAVVRLRTNYMVKEEIAAVEVTVTSTSWASPYTGSVLNDSAGVTDLDCAERSAGDFVEVAIKGDGSNDVFIRSLCLWFDEVD